MGLDQQTNLNTFPVEKAGVIVNGTIWRPGNPIKALGKWTAIDTETLLIDDNKPGEYPELVLLTAYGGGDTVELVWWYDVPAYLAELRKTKTVFVFHNAPFDMNVTGFNDWIPIIDQKRVVDTGIQWVLHKMGTVGLSDEADEYPKLARVCLDVLGEELEKDNAVRCTFTRDMTLDVVHAIYACGDAVATWRCAFVMSPSFKLPPTMDIQIKGFVSLDKISRNGFLVDKEWMANLRRDYLKQMDDLKLTLEDLGIQVDKELSTKEIIQYIRDVLFTNFPENPIIDDLRVAMLYAADNVDKAIDWPGKEDKKKLIKEWKEKPPLNMDAKATSRQLINMLWKIAMNVEEGLPVETDLQEWWDKHEGWPPGYKQEGTTTQLQRLMAESEAYCSEPLPKTESGMYALDSKALDMIPKADLERLKFLGAYKEYKHAEKMVSTYLDDKVVNIDGRVRCRFVPLKSTGRTSSRRPNTQNLPRDDRLRQCYISEPGYILCSCDYSQQELLALAQVTYSRFGHSMMRDLINNDIDIHAFMGVTINEGFKGLPKFDVTDEEIVKAYKKVIKEFKASDPDEFKHLRQLAKALDFGKVVV